MRVITMCGVVALAVVAAGCASSDSTEPGQVFTAADLGKLVAVRPATPGWDWPPGRTAAAPFTREDLEKYEAQYPVQAALSEAHKDAGFVRSEESTWRGETMKGSSFATLFSGAEGAHGAVAATREFAHRWTSEIERWDIADVSAEGLGDDSWGVRGGSPGHAEFVEYGWRRGNVLFEVYITCGQCPSDIEQAARGWADAIDEEARTGA